MSVEIANLESACPDKAFWEVPPEDTPVEEINPMRTVLRLRALAGDGTYVFSNAEFLAMLAALEQVESVLTDLCVKPRINKGDLELLFRALHSPLTS